MGDGSDAPWTDPRLNGEARARAWAEALSPVFDIRVADPDAMAVDRELQNYNLGKMIFGRVDAPAQRLERDRARASAHGVDHVLIQHYLTGHSQIDARGQTQTVQVGDFVLMDLEQPVLLNADAVKALSFVVPRALFGEREMGDLHGTVLSPGVQPFVSTLGSLAREVGAMADTLDATQADALTGVAATLLRLSLGDDPAQNGRRDPIGLKARIRRFMIQNLADPGLDTATVTTRFGVSRSTLYRIFEADGGPQSYIRDLRLARALRRLGQRGPMRPLVSTVAYECGFTSEAVFSRAFRRRFGRAPRDIDPHAGLRAGGVGDRLATWMRELTD